MRDSTPFHQNLSFCVFVAVSSLSIMFELSFSEPSCLVLESKNWRRELLNQVGLEFSTFLAHKKLLCQIPIQIVSCDLT